MIPFTTFYQNVLEEAVPEGLAENLQATFRNAIVNALIEVQTTVPCYRDFHIDFFTKRDCQEYCDLSIINGPRGTIKQIYAFKPGSECKKYYYERRGSQFIQCWTAEQKCVRCSSTTPATTFVYNAPYCNYVIPGQDACEPPYGNADGTEDDTWFKCGCLSGSCDHQKYFCVGPEYQLFLAPRFPCEYVIACQWEGIKRNWADQDVVPEDGDLLMAVVKFVEAEMASKDREWVDVSGLRASFIDVQRQMAQRCRDERRLVQTDDCATPSVDHLLPFINPLPYAETAVSMASTGGFSDADDHILVGRTLRVDQVHGSDQTGRREEWNLPFKSITAAKNAAVSGDLVEVGPGTYNEHNLWKNGVRYYFHVGAKIEYQVPAPTTSTSTNLIGIGSKTFTVDAGLGFVAGDIIAAGIPPNTNDTDEGGSEYGQFIMYGTVTSYNGTNLVINVTSVQGGGNTYSTWLIWGPAWGIFDDRAPGASGTLEVDGFLEFTYRQYNPANLTSHGAVVVENSGSTLNYKGYKSSIGAPLLFGGNTAFGLFSIRNCVKCFIDLDWATDTFESWSNLNNLEPAFSTGGGGTAFFWGQGETHINCRRCSMNYGYSLWAEEPNGGYAGSCYYTGQVMTSELVAALYVSQESSMNTTNYRVWVDVSGEIRGTIAVSSIGPAKIYVNAEKIFGQGHGGANGSAIITSSELWVTAQKISADNAFVLMGTDNNSRDVHITAQHYEDTKNVSNGISNNSVNSNVRLFIHGGYIKLGSQGSTGVNHASGKTILEDVIIDCRTNNTATNYPAIVSSNGLTIKNSAFLAPAATPECLHSGSAFTVQFIGQSIGNKSPAASGAITQLPLASLLGDATFSP